MVTDIISGGMRGMSLSAGRDGDHFVDPIVVNESVRGFSSRGAGIFVGSIASDGGF